MTKEIVLVEWPRRPHLVSFLFWVLVPLDPLPSNLRFTALATVPHCGDPTLTLTTLWGGGANPSCSADLLSGVFSQFNSRRVHPDFGITRCSQCKQAVVSSWGHVPHWLTWRPARPCHLILSESHVTAATGHGGTAARCAFPLIGVLPTLAMLAQRRDALVPPWRRPAGPTGATARRTHISRAASLASTHAVPSRSRLNTTCVHLPRNQPLARLSLSRAAVAGQGSQRRGTFAHSVLLRRWPMW